MDFDMQMKKVIEFCKEENFNDALTFLEKLVNEFYDNKKLYYLLLCISSKAKNEQRLFYYIYYFTEHNIWFDPKLLYKSQYLNSYIDSKLFKYYIEYCSLCKQSYDLI